MRTDPSKYPIVGWQNPVIVPSILGRLVTSGVLPLQEINDRLAVHPLIVGAKQVPIWLELWNWMQLNATDYAAARAALLGQLDSRTIMHPGEILHVVGTLISIEEFGDKVVPDIEAFFLTYIDKVSDDGTLAPETAVFDAFNCSGWGGNGYQNSKHPTFKKVCDHLKTAIALAHKQDMAIMAEAFFHRLRTPGSEDALYERDRKSGKFGGLALLQNIAVDDFANVLVKDSRYNDRLIAALYQRYNLGTGSPELIDEKPWLDDLEAEMRKRAASASAPFRLVLENRTNYWFDEIRKHMQTIALAADRLTVPNADINRP